MRHYKFPTIYNISQVLSAIAGHPEFVVAHKDPGIIVVNYVMMGKDTFPPIAVTPDTDDLDATIRRECRGLIFDASNGDLIARRLHKFFNLGERYETMDVDLSKPHMILEKLDGSMITPFLVPGTSDIRWATKMGITPVSVQAECFVAERPQYEEFASLCLARDRTPIFEWCSNKQRIVVDQPEDRLVLLAVRENESGKYIPRDVLQGWSWSYSIPLVARWSGGVSIDKLVVRVRAIDDAEGIVIQFDDGHMVKVKSDWYVSMHRAKTKIECESDMVKMVLDNTIDDVLPLLNDDNKARMMKFHTTVIDDIHAFVREVMQTIHAFKAMGAERKHVDKFNIPESTRKAACYLLWDCEHDTDAVALVIQNIRRQYPIGNATYARKIKPILKTANWHE